MPHDEHKQECCEEVTKLLRTLIEVEVEQAEQLGRLSAKLETALCILERISRNTCETLNATDELLERLPRPQALRRTTSTAGTRSAGTSTTAAMSTTASTGTITTRAPCTSTSTSTSTSRAASTSPASATARRAGPGSR